MPRRVAASYLAPAVLALFGFVAGALGAAAYKRNQASERWRALRVEHVGVKGQSTRTRLIFDDAKLPVQAVDVLRSPEGVAERAHVAVRGGVELTVFYERGRQPSSLRSDDGTKAVFTYKGNRARVVLLGVDGRELGNQVVHVPVAHRAPLRLARRTAVPSRRQPSWWQQLSLVGQAHAGEKGAPPKEDPQVTVQREVQLMLAVSLPDKGAQPGTAEVEASCAPFTCLPRLTSMLVPSEQRVRIAVIASTRRSKLGAAPSAEQLVAFEKVAREERQQAARVLRDAKGVIAILGITASACKSLQLQLPVCVSALRRPAAVAAAVHAIDEFDTRFGRSETEQRATTLYYQERARALLDREAVVEVCLDREGYASACTKLKGHPLGAQPMPYQRRTLRMRRGIAGTLVGSFDVLQSDGPGCKFSPSPKTSGPLRLTFDNKTGTVTAKLSADQRGSRIGLRCSLGSGDMRWSQKYTATLTQVFDREQLLSGGTLSLRLTGTMNGTGSANQSNCRTSGGAVATCPGGRSNSYSYPMELVGEFNLSTKQGHGELRIRRAPLSTRGLWRVPAKDTR